MASLGSFLLLTTFVVCAYSVVSSIAENWRHARVSEHLAALKQSLAERGMSAEEIERVVRAGLEGDEPARSKESVKT